MENKEITFEAAMARLEIIVKALDGGGVPLADAMSLYEEGVGLVKLCSTQLDGAEQKVKILAAGQDGGVVEKDFSPLSGGEK